VRADTPERLDAGLAALAGQGILDLKEQEAREHAMKISAALGWLENHLLWLMILDNVDDRKAAVVSRETSTTSPTASRRPSQCTAARSRLFGHMVWTTRER
jgi:hypothetical protein